MRISFDIGGVLSKYPHIFRPMMTILTQGGAEVYILTDMHDHNQIISMLQMNGIIIPPERILSADYDTHGERCKAELIKAHNIDLHIDDFPGYCAGGGLQLMVWPNPDLSYYHDDWKTDGTEGNFGRRRSRKSGS